MKLNKRKLKKRNEIEQTIEPACECDVCDRLKARETAAALFDHCGANRRAPAPHCVEEQSGAVPMQPLERQVRLTNQNQANKPTKRSVRERFAREEGGAYVRRSA